MDLRQLWVELPDFMLDIVWQLAVGFTSSQDPPSIVITSSQDPPIIVITSSQDPPIIVIVITVGFDK
jgi:hypothetical protein